MPGININNLPQNLQQKLRPYAFIAKDIESAINMAKRAGNWTDADDAAYSALNGNQAWGQFDGFKKSETQMFIDDLSQALKSDNPGDAFGIAARKAVARDIQRNPEDYNPKGYRRPSGRYVVAQKDRTTGAATLKYYDRSNNEITAADFKRAESITDICYDYNRGQFKVTTKHSEGKTWNQMSGGEKVVAVLGTVLSLGLASCGESEEVTEYNFYNENKNVINVYNNYEAAIAAMNTKMDEINATMKAIIDELKNIKNNTGLTNDWLSSLVDLQTDIIKKLSEISNNTQLTAQEIEQLKNEIIELQKRLDEANKNLITIITNQETFAKSAEEYYKNILAAINGNTEVLKYIVEQLTANNETLKQIKELMEKSNATQEQILEAVTKCKYGIDQLHEDNGKIINLLEQISKAIEKLPDNLKNKFSDYFKAIITGIADNGAKLDALTNLLKVVNANIVAGNTAILNKLDKMQAVLDALFAKFDQFDKKTTNLLNTIATAIANMSAKIDQIDLTKIEETLSAILDKITANQDSMDAKMEELTKLLKLINQNVVLNGKTQQEILEAINKLDGNMVAEFTKLVETVNKNNDLSQTANKLLTEILAAIKNFKPEINVDLTDLINSIYETGADLRSKMTDIYSLLKTINGNVIEGNENVKLFLSQILHYVAQKPDCDMSAVLAKLQEILEAIKNHKVDVQVTVDGKFVICDENGNVVNEGEIDNLDWLLG